MSRLKVLYVCHNHPTIRPGGAEQYALELYEAMRETDRVEPILLARTGPPLSNAGPPHPGTPFGRVNDDPNQILFYTDTSWDSLHGTLRNKVALTLHYREFLTALRPDVVHFQHTAQLGYDMIRLTHETLPLAALVYTLHDFRPICHHHGLLVRTMRNELCLGAAPEKCHACFPAVSPEAFFMRQRFIQSHLALIDLFLAPSRVLMERFIDWGIEAERIQFLDYGRQLPSLMPTQASRSVRARFGFFGQVNPVKGVDVLLRAMQTLSPVATGRSADQVAQPHLWMNAANLDLQRDQFRDDIAALLAATRSNVTWSGPYGTPELPDRMAEIDWVVVPSIWWENSPLVIQEAFLHGRPVLCSDIGGMAEKVSHGVNGLHFRVGDPTDLAHTMRRAVSEPSLWDRLRAGIPTVPTIDDSVAFLTDLYFDILARPQPSRRKAQRAHEPTPVPMLSEE